MANFRIDMISEEIRKELDRIIRDTMHDPRIQGTFSIVRADVTKDLRYAKVYISLLESERGDDMIAALNKAAGFIRRELGMRLSLRYVPQFSFVQDKNIEYGIHIAQILKQVIHEPEISSDETDSE